jgi:signal transduction histidine kinase
MQSLERRLGIGLALALGITCVLILLVSVAAVRTLSEAYTLTRLEHDAEALAAAVAHTPRGGVKLREGRISPIYQQPLSGHYFTVRLSTGATYRSRSLWDETLAFDDLQPGEVKVSNQPGPGGQALLTRTAGYARDGQPFTLAVAEDLGPLSAQIHAFQLWALAGLSLALIAVLWLQRRILRHAFRSLDTMRHEIEQVMSGTRDRLDQLGPDEVRPLALEINRLLLQLQQRLRRSRESLANLAHAIKSPLARLVQDVDTLDADPKQGRRIHRNLQQIVDLIDHELRRGSMAGASVGQHFRPDRDVPELVAALQQLYRDRGLAIAVPALPSTLVAIDRQDLVELLGNLLDNACKHARAQVQLELEIDSALHLLVADDGPGIAAAELASLPTRGRRLDERTAGHGLGLSIVQDIVNDHGGQLRLTRSAALGGLAAEVTLPLPTTRG